MEDTSGTRMPKACRTCAKAKVRCEPQADGICKRCRRLNKDCSDQAPGSHRRQKGNKTSNIEVSALEAKLDRMVALLAASERSSKDPQSNPSHSPDASSSMHHDEDGGLPSNQEAEALIDVFRNRMIPLFPFIAIPPNLTAEQLRREKPFLYLNITMVACHDSARQRNIVKAIKQYVAEHIVSEGQHNLDLLQGLLIHLTWFISVPRVPANSPRSADPLCSTNIDGEHQVQAKLSGQLDVFLQLAVAQVVSLNLNQGLSALKSMDRPLSYFRGTDFQPNQIPPRTLEERRAYLGCYYVTVMLASCVRDVGAMRFTKYTHECCEELLRASEFPTDPYLVQLVRLMQLADKVSRAMSLNEFESFTSISAPLGLTIRSYEAELQQLKNSFASELPYSIFLSFHYSTIETLLYRIALNEEVSDPLYGDYSTTRLDLLFRCLEAAKSFFRDLHALPPGYLLFFPFTVWCQFGQALITLSRMTLFQGENIGWDQAYARGSININQLAELMTQKLNDAHVIFLKEYPILRSSDERPEILERLVIRMSFIKEVHRKRQEAQAKANLQIPQEPPDLSFLMDMPIDAYFPYGNYGEMPTAPFVPMDYF